MRAGDVPSSSSSSVTGFLRGLVWPYRWRLLAGIGVLLVTTGAMMAIPQLLKGMFDNALLVGDRAALARAAGWMMGLSFLLAMGVLARSQLIQLTATRVAVDLREQLVAQLLRLEVGWFEKQLSGELVSRLSADVAVLRDFVQLALPMVVRGVLVGIGAVVALLSISVALTGLLLLAVLPLGVAGWWLGGKIRLLNKAQQARLAEFSGALAEQVSQPGLIRAFRQEDTVMARMRALLADILRNSRIQLLAGSGFVALNVLLGFWALVGVVWLGGLQVLDGKLTLGAMMAFLLYLGFLADAASNLSSFWPAWQGLVGALDRVVEILRERPRIADPANPVALPVAGMGRAVALEGVQYAYPTRPEALVADGLDLRIKAGQKVALVGPSGAGKSTLFRLMLRLDDVQGGRVLLDGVDVRTAALAEVRRQFALVSQEAPLFSGTVRDNVAFGVPGAADDDIWAALAVANADGFVRELPQGLETLVGERGVQLSGGQRQRVAIARAVLVDAPILLLDEATSHLDTDSEKLVQQALERAGVGRTVITIAHRLSTVVGADCIFVLEKGRVAACGTHAELMETSALYRGLAALGETGASGSV